MLDKDNILQQNVPLSKCGLWKQQREFFEQQGIKAWEKRVPFSITNNPYIAASYAHIIIRFIQDYIAQDHYNPIEPFYIIELGAGSGAFGFYVIKALLELKNQLGLPNKIFNYVMTDFTASNVNFWQTHDQLNVYVKQGILDFAQFDAEHDTHIHLIHANTSLNTLDSSDQFDNPLIVIANYVFDSINHDVFKIQAHQLQEGLVTLRSTQQESLKKSYPKEDLHMAEQVDIAFTYRDCHHNYYQDNRIDVLLKYYAKYYEDITLLFPIGSLRAIQRLQALSNNQLLVIATDKGYSNHIEDYSSQAPNIVYSSNFSLMVNFHAIGLYARYAGGDYYYQSRQQDIVSCAFIFGQKWQNLPETRLALTTFLDRFSPGNLYGTYLHMQATKYQCDLATFLNYLETTYWDPQIFNDCLDTILTAIQTGHVVNIKDLMSHLHQLTANTYYLPSAPNTFFNIGFLLQQLQEYKMATNYYKQALRWSQDDETAYYQLGICYYHLQDYQQAIVMFERTLQINSEKLMAYGWLKKAKTAMKTMPVIKE
jgi:tetratricopeptide (TPR) repeat protein